MLPIHTILHPTDFSDASKSAFEMACSLARDYRAKLVLLHVIPPAHIFAPDGVAVAFPSEQPFDAQAKLATLHPDDPRVDVDHHVVEGDPATEILKAASIQKADVIVMGTHGKTGLTRLLVGSVAEDVMRKAPCPVLTVRGPFHASAEIPPKIESEPVSPAV
jgi:nucleotide-binding universal stress UspA family protein